MSFLSNTAIANAYVRQAMQNPELQAAMVAATIGTPAAPVARMGLSRQCACFVGIYEAAGNPDGTNPMPGDIYNRFGRACESDPKAFMQSATAGAPPEVVAQFKACATPWWRSKPVLIGAAALAGFLVVRKVIR